MKQRVLTLAVGLAIGCCGCIMVNSTTTMDTQAKVQYRTTETALHGSSNCVSNASTWEGGGKLDASLPAAK